MKYLPIIESENPVELQVLKDECKSGRQIGKVTLGTDHLFFREKFSKTKYIAFSDIYRVFRRVQCVNVRMCCANGQLELNNIVVCDKKQELAMFDLPSERAAVGVIEHIQENYPNIKIGMKK